MRKDLLFIRQSWTALRSALVFPRMARGFASLQSRVTALPHLYGKSAPMARISRPLLSQWPLPVACCGEWTPDGRNYIFVGDTISAFNLFSLREPPGLLRRSSSAPAQLTAGPLSFFTVVPSTDGKKLFERDPAARAACSL